MVVVAPVMNSSEGTQMSRVGFGIYICIYICIYVYVYVYKYKCIHMRVCPARAVATGLSWASVGPQGAAGMLALRRNREI